MHEPMILIVADIEGVSGIVDWTQEEYETERVRELLVGDINAAVAGVAEEIPEAEILVTDGHGHKLTVPIEQLHPSARLVRGGPRDWGLVAGIESDPDYAMYVGAHDRPSTGGVLEHVFRKTAIAEIRLGGTPVGEVELNSLVLDEHGVDVVLVTGDDVLRERVESTHVDAAYVETKTALGSSAAVCRHPQAVREEIEATSKRLFRGQIPNISLDVPVSFPVDATVQYDRPEKAQTAALWPGIGRLDSRTISYQCEDAATMYRFVRAASKV